MGVGEEEEGEVEPYVEKSPMSVVWPRGVGCGEGVGVGGRRVHRTVSWHAFGARCLVRGWGVGEGGTG